MKELNTPELNKLSGYLEALGNFIIGADYVTWFEAKGFDLTGSAFDVEDVIKGAYPGSKPEKGEIIVRSDNNMIERVNKSLKLPDPPYSRSDFRGEIEMNLINGYWKYLKACIDYEKANIIEYIPSQSGDDELWDFIHWGFTFLIYSEEQRRCVIIHGGASD
ncbi:MAG TPA: hypothetical protein VF791_17585 [Pyrinomonadaceae bacterium]